MSNIISETLFPKNPHPGQVVQIPNKEIFMYDGSLWNLLGGRFIDKSTRDFILSYLLSLDIDESINIVKIDLEFITNDENKWGDIFMKNLIRTLKNIRRVKIHN